MARFYRRVGDIQCVDICLQACCLTETTPNICIGEEDRGLRFREPRDMDALFGE